MQIKWLDEFTNHFSNVEHANTLELTKDSLPESIKPVVLNFTHPDSLDQK